MQLSYRLCDDMERFKAKDFMYLTSQFRNLTYEQRGIYLFSLYQGCNSKPTMQTVMSII